MNRIKYRISLDMLEVASQITIKVKKGDTACSIHVTLTESGKIYHISDGCYAVFSAKKPDGNYLFNNETCRIEDNTIIYDFTEQTTPIEGIVECELILYKDEDKLTSPRFNLKVDATVYNGEEIVSTPEADALKELTNRAENIVAQFDEGVIIGKDYADNNFANALKGSASGEIVSIKDVSPIEHDVDVKVKGMTEVNVTAMDGVCSQYDFVGGTDNFVFKSKEKLSCGACFDFVTDQDTSYWVSTDETFVVDEDCYWYVTFSNMVLHFAFYRDAELTDLVREDDVNVAYENLETKITRIDFCGSTHDVLITQEEYEYAPAANTSISVGGKNLLNLEGRSVVNFGAQLNTSKRTFSGGNGIILRLAANNYYDYGHARDDAYTVTENSVSYAIQNDWYGIGFDIKLKPNTQYKFRRNKDTAKGLIYLIEYDKEGNYIKSTSMSVNAVTTSPTTDWGVILFAQAIGYVVGGTDLQIEYGEVSTEYEPYIEPVIYTTNADGTVIGAKSMYPSMSITSDTPGTMIEVEYNRDINKAFAELSAAVISLGGNV